MNSTPRDARAIAPGLARRDPPPTRAASVAEWCGASNGGVRESDVIASPVSERTDATSRAAASSSGGRIPGRRRASIVLPAPGGPDMSRWWPPAAATSSASTASGCPTTSARSGGGALVVTARAAAVGDGSGPSSTASSTSAPCRRAACARLRTAVTSAPVTSSASARFSSGTTTRVLPASTAASTAGSTPGTARTRPSRPSSPTCTVLASDSGSSRPSVARAASATERSKPDPCLGRLAGERLTVSRRSGSASPLFSHAFVTRRTASPSALSGMPMSRKSGLCCVMSASTSISAPWSPVRATAHVRTTITAAPAGARPRPSRDPAP